MKKVIGYIRVSTNHQDLERQKTLIKKYCDDNGLILIRLIEDYGISGADNTRAGYLELQALTGNDCDMIVVSELSRLSRDEDVMNTLNTIYALISKFDLVMLDDLSNIYSKGAKLDFIEFMRLAFKAYGAADERKKITERMKTGKDSILRRYPMACMNSTIPLGFKKIAHPDHSEKAKGIPKSILVPDEESMALVRRIYEWVDEGLSTYKIAHKLVAMGYKSQRGFVLSQAYLIFLLHQTLYIGQRSYKGEIYPTGEAYIDPDLWHRVQDKLSANKTKADKFTKHINPLKGILKCACGCNMQIVAQNEGKSIQYACISKKYRNSVLNTIKPCNYYSIKTNYLNDILWYDVKYRVLDKEYQAKSNDKIEALKLENLQLSQNISNKEAEISSKKVQQDQIIDNIATSTNARVVEALNKRVDSIDDEIKAINTFISNIKTEIAKNNKRIKEELKSQSIKDLQDMTIEGKAQIFKEMLEKVEYISTIQRAGFIVITYKNGIKSIYLYRFKNNKPASKSVISLPNAFKYNPETKKVSVTYIGEKDKLFSLKTTAVEYDPDELYKDFNFEPESIITDSIFKHY